VLGEVFQVVGHVFPGAGGQVQVVDLIDFTDHCTVSTRPDLRLLIDYMSATESARMLTHLFRRVAEDRRLPGDEQGCSGCALLVMSIWAS